MERSAIIRPYWCSVTFIANGKPESLNYGGGQSVGVKPAFLLQWLVSDKLTNANNLKTNCIHLIQTLGY
jgi:hypothetical protein